MDKDQARLLLDQSISHIGSSLAARGITATAFEVTECQSIPDALHLDITIRRLTGEVVVHSAHMWSPSDAEHALSDRILVLAPAIRAIELENSTGIIVVFANVIEFDHSRLN